MKTIIKRLKKQVYMIVIILLAPIVSIAETLTAEEEAAQSAKIALWSEIGIGVLFAVALVVFLVYKTKHDKKLREKHLEQMKKVMAAKKKAA